MENGIDVLYLNSTRDGSLSEKNIALMNGFMEACSDLELLSRIATDSLGVQGMRNRKRRRHNVLIVDFLAIAKSRTKIDNSFRQVYQALCRNVPSGYIPLYLLCENREELEIARKVLGSIARGIFLSSSEVVMMSICQELKEIFSKD